MRNYGSLKALASVVLLRASDAEVPHEMSKRTSEQSNGTVQGIAMRSGVPGSGRGTVEQGLNPTTNRNIYTQIYRSRIRRARDRQDLYTILTDAQVAFVNGDVTGADVERLARDAITRSHSLPERDPSSGAER